jgi:RNA polymerase sigma factor (sigma-70 family)
MQRTGVRCPPMVPSELTAPNATDAATLARRYRAALRRYFERRLPDPTEAEDLAQEVLLRLTARQATDADPRKTLTSYIFLTARSVLMDKLRRDRVRERGAHCELENAGHMEVPSAERVYSGQEQIERVSQLMAGLTPRVREVFMMHRVEGLAYSDIARALGISVSTVEKHMIAALRFLLQHAQELE